VDLDGDVAHVDTYVLYIVRTLRKDERLGSGRYLDVLERRAGEWRIVLREFLAEMGNRGVPSALVESPWTARGTWDRGDLSCVRPLPRRPESARRCRLHQLEWASDQRIALPVPARDGVHQVLADC
jgi:hypothetical protein